MSSQSGKTGELLKQLDPARLPAHVAVIMDGNGRWAGKRGLPRIAGHRQGMATVRRTLKFADSLGIKVLSLFAFSTENWSRPKMEIRAIMALLREYLRKEVSSLHENNVKIRMMGYQEKLSESLIREIAAAIEKTKNNMGIILNVGLNYSGRQDILHGVRGVLKAYESGALPKNGIGALSEENFSDYLFTSGLPDPDLLIRTSGELRISNFMLWQMAYTEIFISQVLWPDFGEADFLEALIDYQKRDRRFGRV